MWDWVATPERRVLVLVCAIVTVVLLATAWRRRRREHEWSRVARRLKLQFALGPEGPLVDGSLRGRPVKMFLPAESSDAEAGVVVVRIESPIRQAPATLSAEAAVGVIGELAQLAEKQVPTGDEQFDKDVRVHGDDPDEIRRFWTASRRRAFLNLAQSRPEDRLELESGLLSLERRAIALDRRELKSLLLDVAELSQTLDSDSPAAPAQ